MKDFKWAPADIYWSKANGTNIKFKTRGAYLPQDLRQKFSKNPDSFFLELNILDENIKLIERFFAKVISGEDELNSRKSLLKSIKVNSGLRSMGHIDLGGKNFLDIDDSD